MNNNAEVIIGIPTYNHIRQVRNAVGSLLEQTHSVIGIVIVDDLSTDGTYQILKDLQSKDDRIKLFQNKERLGYISNAQKCFALAKKHYPNMKYFAWGSDHDYWHPKWLENLHAEMVQNANLILAWPLSERIDGENKFEKKMGLNLCETFKSKDSLTVIKFVCKYINAGNMVYGLFRENFLTNVGGLQMVLFPDRLLVIQAAFYGEIKQVKKSLWFRRYSGLASSDRQIRASFVNLSDRLKVKVIPWYIQHAWHLWKNTRKKREVRCWNKRYDRLYAVFIYTLTSFSAVKKKEIRKIYSIFIFKRVRLFFESRMI